MDKPRLLLLVSELLKEYEHTNQEEVQCMVKFLDLSEEAKMGQTVDMEYFGADDFQRVEDGQLVEQE
jgi:hypothetical protein